MRNIIRMISLTHKRKDMHITYYTYNTEFTYIVVCCEVMEETLLQVLAEQRLLAGYIFFKIEVILLDV